MRSVDWYPHGEGGASTSGGSAVIGCASAVWGAARPRTCVCRPLLAHAVTPVCRFVGARYPLCQNASWVPRVALDLYLMDAGVVEGTAWAEGDVTLATDPPRAIEVVGRDTDAWNPQLCASRAA